MFFYRYAYEAYQSADHSEYQRSLLPTPYEKVVSHNLFTYRYYTSEAENDDSTAFYVVSCGYERRPPQGARHRNRSYNRYSFHYIMGGKGVYRGASLSAGQMLIIPPCDELYFESDPQDPLEFYYISVAGKDMKSVFNSAGFDLTVHLTNCPFISEIPKLFYSPLFESHPDSDPYFYLMSLFFRLMAYHKKHNVSEVTVSKGTAFYYYSQAIYYIESYLLSDLTPESIAKFLNISYSYLRKIFSVYANCSVRDYILKKRFQHAADKLALTQCSVSEAATLLGYSDYVHFSKMFKKLIGQSPSAYKALHTKPPATAQLPGAETGES